MKEKCWGYQKFNANIMIENKFSILRYMHEICLSNSAAIVAQEADWLARP